MIVGAILLLDTHASCMARRGVVRAASRPPLAWMNKSSFASQRRSSRTFKDFFASNKSGGIVLIVCTLLSLLLSNAPASESYLAFWHLKIAGMSIKHWDQ